MSLPAADDLFRRTAVPEAAEPAAAEDGAKADRAPSGRVKHDEKMTVYVTADELLDL